MLKTFEKIPLDAVALMARLALAGVFLKSGLTKVIIDGASIEFSGSVQYLFEQEYMVPLLPWDVAALLATSAELLIPPLLIIGLATRFAALALLGMTAVIQLFVYPAAWDTHLMWATAMVFLMAHGAGRLSLDAIIRRPSGNTDSAGG